MPKLSYKHNYSLLVKRDKRMENKEEFLYGLNPTIPFNATVPIVEDPNDTLACLRRSAVIHKLARNFARSLLTKNTTLHSIAEQLENKVAALCASENSLVSCQAFPTGLSQHNVAAHFAPNPGLHTNCRFEGNGVLSVDFGVHTFGWLVDSAFSVSLNPEMQPLLEASRTATETGLRKAGPGARLGEIGAAIRETMESFTVSFSSNQGNVVRPPKEVPVRVVQNLNGHSIRRYQVHGGKTVPCYDNGDCTRMEAGEVFAIETFASTGRGFVEDFGSFGDVSHYMLKDSAVLASVKYPHLKPAKQKRLPRSVNVTNLKTSTATTLLKTIQRRYGGLAFCKRWVSDVRGYLGALLSLERAAVVAPYPPLADVKGSQTSQFEHTFFVKEEGIEVLTKDEDY